MKLDDALYGVSSEEATEIYSDRAEFNDARIWYRDSQEIQTLEDNLGFRLLLKYLGQKADMKKIALLNYRDSDEKERNKRWQEFTIANEALRSVAEIVTEAKVAPRPVMQQAAV